MDVKDEPDLMLTQLARSTAVLVKSSQLKTISQNSLLMELPSETFQESFGVCPTEPFAQQPNPGFCSGFLVTKDLFVTAGHCMASPTSCAETAIVFGFSVEVEGQDPSKVQEADVYLCEKIIAREQDPVTLNDFTVIKLNRSVEGREPLAYRKTGAVSIGDPMTVIGHPSGLPTKIASGAWVRSNDADKFFVANLDSYGGNSGSAVFNTETGEVEGILVRGENDFVRQNNCIVSNVCNDFECRGEDVTRAIEFAKYIPNDETSEEEQTAEIIVKEHSNLALAIPDADANGVDIYFDIEQEDTITHVSIYLNIAHTYIGDLKISFSHPDGTQIVLQNRTGGSKDDLEVEFGAKDVEVPALSNLQGKLAAGTWKIKVSDLAWADVGKLRDARLALKTQKTLPL
ncbi:MAG: trypsin-like peptidase domain-containing protein [Bdellovibrionota bacterium]